MKIPALLALAASVVPTAARAEVVTSSSNGFHVRQSIDLPVPPDAAFARFARIGSWWDDRHTYGGKATTMSLELRPGGCFCEKLESGGGVEHMRVSYVDSPKRIVLTGSLGPLLTQATAGAMDVRIEPRPGGSRISLDYRVAGFFDGGADKLAPAVGQVLGIQLQRLAALPK